MSACWAFSLVAWISISKTICHHFRTTIMNLGVLIAPTKFLVHMEKTLYQMELYSVQVPYVLLMPSEQSIPKICLRQVHILGKTNPRSFGIALLSEAFTSFASHTHELWGDAFFLRGNVVHRASAGHADYSPTPAQPQHSVLRGIL
jgi:hypothetical protein